MHTAPTALTTLTHSLTLRLQNEGPGDEADSTPLCIRDTCPHLCSLSDPSQVQGAQYCLGVRCVTAKVGFPLPQAENGAIQRGPAGGKAGQKEALVRHWAAGRWTTHKHSSCFIKNQRAAWEEEAGSGGSSCSWTPCEDPGTWVQFPWNQTQSPQLPKASACPWTLLLFCPSRVAAERLPR